MHPFAALPASTRLPVLGTLLVVTLGLAWVLGEQAKPLKLAGTVPDGMLSAEFAWSSERLREVVAAWGPDLLAAARQVLTLDFAFALAYPLLLALGCALVADVPDAPQAAVGVFLSWAVLAAFPLEAVENAILLRLFADDGVARGGEAWARVVGVCAGLKFTLAFAAVGYILLGQFGLIAGRLGLGR